MVTIDDIRRIGQPAEKLQEDSEDCPYIFVTLRRVSPYFTKFFIEHGISANQASSFAILLASIGSILFVFSNTYLMLFSGAIYLLAHLMDQTDGEIARTTNTKTVMGEFLEGITWHIADFFFFIFFGLGLYCAFKRVFFILCGFSFALAMWITRSLRQSVEATVMKDVLDMKHLPLIQRNTLSGKLYRKYYKMRMFFAVFRIGFLLLPFLEAILPMKPSFTIYGVTLTILSTYFLLYGFDTIGRTIYTIKSTRQRLNRLA